MSVYVCMYMYCYTQKGFLCNKDYYYMRASCSPYELYIIQYLFQNKTHMFENKVILTDIQLRIMFFV